MLNKTTHDPCDGCGQEIDDPEDTGNIENMRLCQDCIAGWPTYDDAMADGTIGPKDHPGITTH